MRTFLVVLLFALPVQAEPDLPHVMRARHVNQNNWVDVRCSKVARSRDVKCEISQVMVLDPPSKTDAIARWMAVETGPWTTKLQKWCDQIKDQQFQSAQKQAQQKRRIAACDASSPAALAAIQITEAREESRTCQVVNLPPETIQFTSQDANTWTQTQKTKIGVCPVTVTRTLWRTGEAWNYSLQQVAESSVCIHLERKNDWTFSDHDRIPLPCKYLAP